MGLINKKWDKILELLFNYPNKTFTIRKISKITNIPTSTVQRYLKELEKESIIKNNQFSYNNYSKFIKTYFMVEKIYKSNLIDYLEKELNPSVIIIFGGIRKGEYDKNSDIDLFIETAIKKELNLEKFEKILKHKIDLFIESDITKLQKNLLSNIINGIKLSGYIDIK